MIGDTSITIYVLCENDGLTREERLKRVVEHCYGPIDTALLKVEKTSLGKPYFPNMPNLHFSISHSGNYWACALSTEEVGLDIQEHGMLQGETKQEATVRFTKMARRFFHPKEAEYVEIEGFHRFFGVWAARESYVKYTGQGIDSCFSEHCVVPEGKENLWDLPGWKACGCWFWETIFDNNYTLCLCSGRDAVCSVITEVS